MTATFRIEEIFARRSHTDESPDLLALADELAQLESASSNPPRWRTDDFLSAASSAVDHLIVGRAAASDAKGYALWRLAAPGADAELLSISVDPACRRRGFGTALLLFVINGACEQDALALMLEVDPANLAALTLYRNAGFEEVARRTRYYRSGADALLMRKPL